MISGQSNIPQVVSFSAVVRDQNNQLLVNTPVTLRLSFHQGAPTDPIVYCELHQETTNANGFISVQFNRNVFGTCTENSDIEFEEINWEDGNMWLEVEYQIIPTEPFIPLGTLELASSFYSFAAGTAERLVGFQLEGAQEGDVITYNATTGQWEASASSAGFSGDYNDLTNAPDLSGINTDNQQLSVSATGDTLHLQNGGFVIIPGLSAANNSVGYTPGAGVSFDGYAYSSIILGNGQEWMAENLRTTVYSNGDPIPGDQWENLTTGAWAYYNNDSQYDGPLGKLYNWYAINDSRNVCPSGWHVPTDVEWSMLINFLDPNADGGNNVNIAGGKMKSTGTEWWSDPNADATNEIGFSALPGGTFSPAEGQFIYGGINGNWWSSTEQNSEFAWYRILSYNYGSALKYYTSKTYGFSCRCLRD